MEQFYADHKYMLYERSARFASQTGVPFDELVSEANLIFCETCLTYDDTKGCKFSTWLYNELNRHLYHFTCKFNRPQWKGIGSAPEPRTPPEFISPDLSKDAEQIVHLLFSSTTEIALLLGSPKKARGVLMRKAREHDMSWSQIWRAFRELKEIFGIKNKNIS